MFQIEIFKAIAVAHIIKITTGQDIKLQISDTGTPILSNKSTSNNTSQTKK